MQTWASCRQNNFPDGWKWQRPTSAKYGIMKDRNLPMDHQEAHRQLFVFAQNTFVLAPQRYCHRQKKQKWAGNVNPCLFVCFGQYVCLFISYFFVLLFDVFCCLSLHAVLFVSGINQFGKLIKFLPIPKLMTYIQETLQFF